VEAAQELKSRLLGTGIRGTVLIAEEGVNFNLAGPREVLSKLVSEWLRAQGCEEFEYKTSYSDTLPFKRLKIKVKSEIITMGDKSFKVREQKSPHISAKDFEALLKNPGNTLILDTRNEFEFDFGTFRGATKVPMKSFRDFPKFAETLDPKTPIAMFCTGGVRCEKASAFLRTKGFESVLQLKGGVLRYLEECGPEMWDGKCFVFDERVALRDIDTTESLNS